MLANALAIHSEPPRASAYPALSRRTDKSIFENQKLSSIPRTYDKNEYIFREGDAASNIYFVEDGYVCVYRITLDGHRQVVDFAYPGDLIGLGDLEEHENFAQAMSKTRVRPIPNAAIHEFAKRDSEFAARLYEALSRELLATRQHLVTVSQFTAAQRVAAFLLDLSRCNERRGDDPNTLVLPMTRQDIADFLGLTIETVSRQFSRLKASGIIDLEQCIHVTICDAEGLANLADGA